MAQLSSAPLALGHTAELYAWVPGTVLKLYHAGWPASEPARELALVNAAVAAGLRTPAARGLVDVELRHGIVFDRVDGPSMLDLLFRDPGAAAGYASQLADLHVTLLAQQIDGVPSLHARLAGKIERAQILSPEQRRAALDALAALPQGAALCHGDFHPGNVLLPEDGAVVIDWVDAAAGPPAADVARTLLLVAVGTIPLPDETLRRALVAARQEFSRLYAASMARSDMVERDLVERWLWPMAAGRLSEKLADADNDQLLRLLARRDGEDGRLRLADLFAVGSG